MLDVLALPSWVVAQLGVLSRVAEAASDDDSTCFQLPAEVTLSDFVLWQAASAQEIDAASRCNSFTLDLAWTCSVLKVADALDDKDFDHWIRCTALFISCPCYVDGWAAREASGTVQLDLGPLVQMPESLQYMVYAHAAKHHSSCLPYLLRILPASSHHIIVSAYIPADKTVLLYDDWDSIQDLLMFFLDGLASMRQSPPPFTALIEDNPDFRKYTHPGGILAHLAAAISQHAGITSLELANACSTQSGAEVLAPAIASITALEELELGSFGAPMTAATASSLNQILHPLTRLRHLALDIRSKAERYNMYLDTPPKRKDRVVMAIMHAISGATSLTSLVLNTFSPTPVSNAISDPDAYSMSLPSLEYVYMTGPDHELSASLLCNLIAPVTELRVEFDQVLMMYPPPLDHSLHRFTQLRHLEAVQSEVAFFRHTHAPAFTSDCFCQLQELRLKGEFPGTASALQQVSEAGAALTHLRMTVLAIPGEIPVAGWARACAALCSLPLQDLSIEIMPPRVSLRRANPRGHSLPGISCLLALTGLTSLVIRGWSNFCKTDEDCEAISGMQQLQSMDALVGEVQDPGLLHSLAALPRLTFLKLITQFNPGSLTLALAADGQDGNRFDVMPGLKSQRAAGDSGGLWPQLRRLFCSASSHEEAYRIAKCAKDMRQLELLNIVMCRWHPELGPADEVLPLLPEVPEVAVYVY